MTAGRSITREERTWDLVYKHAVNKYVS